VRLSLHIAPTPHPSTAACTFALHATNLPPLITIQCSIPLRFKGTKSNVCQHALAVLKSYMQCRYLSGRSNSGLHMAHGVRDLDAMTARPPLPPRALPDDIRIKLKLASRPADHVRIFHAQPQPRLLSFLLERIISPKGCGAGHRRRARCLPFHVRRKIGISCIGRICKLLFCTSFVKFCPCFARIFLLVMLPVHPLAQSWLLKQRGGKAAAVARPIHGFLHNAGNLLQMSVSCLHTAAPPRFTPIPPSPSVYFICAAG
jgi:hypothetical protein